ncbi:hypothetical protein FB192DRAFT_1455889 [Mucor lusitanicus]|uniref:Uncharacterized protein n=1 Tax=Mucor circinelloides f. lusitanicus TaxID=29924 RepID=A0A8H4BQM8_MUCCL|nr:hypothetical protein FB192DRAFT_1455889 [Mucor lusitanicus]
MASVQQQLQLQTTESASHPSPSSDPKRSFDEQKGQDSVVVPLSSPRQRRGLTYGGYEDGGTTATTHDIELVPPLMDEAAPFRRIYNTEYLDTDFMTSNRQVSTYGF